MNTVYTALAVLMLCIVIILFIEGCNTPIPSILYSESHEDFTTWAISMKGSTAYTTMYKLSVWMKEHMRYESDGLFDYYKPVLKTWWQTGDCEDWSRVALEALHINGYTEFFFLSVYYETDKGPDGHTVCTDGTAHVSNWGCYYGFSGVRSVVEQVSAGRWVRYTLRDKNLTLLEVVNR